METRSILYRLQNEDIVYAIQKYIVNTHTNQGDFDGDTFRLIGLYTNDSNAEAERIQNAPMNYVDGTGGFMRGLTREAGLAIYMLTKD